MRLVVFAFTLLSALNLPAMMKYRYFFSRGDQIISKSDFEELVDALSCDIKLNKLTLCSVALDDHRVEALALALQNHPSIQLIDLSENDFSHNGVKALVALIEVNSCIKGLCLSNTPLLKESVMLWGEMLKKNKSLHYLSLTGFELNEEEAQIFLDSLTMNTSLIALHFPNTDLKGNVGEWLHRIQEELLMNNRIKEIIDGLENSSLLEHALLIVAFIGEDVSKREALIELEKLYKLELAPAWHMPSNRPFFGTLKGRVRRMFKTSDF